MTVIAIVYLAALAVFFGTELLAIDLGRGWTAWLTSWYVLVAAGALLAADTLGWLGWLPDLSVTW